MKREEFLKQLGKRLRSLKDSERKKQLEYYSEMIADMTESGMGEEEAVEKIGRPEEIAGEILEQCGRENLKERDIKGAVLLTAAVCCGVISLGFGIFSLGFGSTWGLRSGFSVFVGGADGPTSVFIAGKISQPVWFYGLTILLIGVTIFHYLKKRKKY